MTILNGLQKLFGQNKNINEEKEAEQVKQAQTEHKEEKIKQIIENNDLYKAILKGEEVMKNLLSKKYNYFCTFDSPRRMSYRETIGEIGIEVKGHEELFSLTLYEGTDRIAKFQILDNRDESIEFVALKLNGKYEKTNLLTPMHFEETFTQLSRICYLLKINPYNLKSLEAMDEIRVVREKHAEEMLREDPLTILTSR